jgi:hypothetical protein
MLSIVAIGNAANPALACETNAKGCVNNGGPGQSVSTPPKCQDAMSFRQLPYVLGLVLRLKP